MPTFKQGYDLAAAWRADGAGADTTMYIRGYDADAKVDMLETTHTGSGGKEAYYAGIFRDSGKVEFLIDISAYPWGAIGIQAGAKGTVRLGMGGSTPESKHVLIENVVKKSVVNGMLEGEFNYRLDSNSNAQGTSYPYNVAT